MKLPSEKINVYMVRKTIGAGSLNVGTLCTHKNVNKWSRYKPVNHSKRVPITIEERITNNFGLNLPKIALGETLTSEQIETIKNSTEWEYEKPAVYRLSDFANYAHTLDTSYGNEQQDTVKAKSSQSNNYLYFDYSFHQDSSSELSEIDGMLSPSNLRLEPLVSTSTNLGEMYAGVALYKMDNSGNGTLAKIQTTTSYIGTTTRKASIELPVRGLNGSFFWITFLSTKALTDWVDDVTFVPIENSFGDVTIIDSLIGEILFGGKIGNTEYYEFDSTTQSGATIDVDGNTDNAYDYEMDSYAKYWAGDMYYNRGRLSRILFSSNSGYMYVSPTDVSLDETFRNETKRLIELRDRNADYYAANSVTAATYASTAIFNAAVSDKQLVFPLCDLICDVDSVTYQLVWIVDTDGTRHLKLYDVDNSEYVQTDVYFKSGATWNAIDKTDGNFRIAGIQLWNYLNSSGSITGIMFRIIQQTYNKEYGTWATTYYTTLLNGYSIPYTSYSDPLAEFYIGVHKNIAADLTSHLSNRYLMAGVVIADGSDVQEN